MSAVSNKLEIDCSTDYRVLAAIELTYKKIPRLKACASLKRTKEAEKLEENDRRSSVGC